MDARLVSSGYTAGSFHITATNSLKRLRAPTSHMQASEEDEDPVVSQSHGEALLSDVASYLKQILFPAATQLSSNRHTSSWSKFMKCMLVAYCFLSFIVFSLDLYTQVPLSGVGQNDRSLSAFDDTPTAQRLSRLFSFRKSEQLELDPFIIRAQERAGDVVSACLWTSELQDFELVRSWASQWQGKEIYEPHGVTSNSKIGPVSLLMTTTALPDSRSSTSLLRHLHNLSSNPLSGLSVHLLRVTMLDQASSNSYLNLARFFAPTSLVMLVPANVSQLPDISHKTVVSQMTHSNMRPHLLVTGQRNRSDFSEIPPLSPIILRRNDPVWCAERFFLRQSRTSEWGACLWQHWLDSFGNFVDISTGQGKQGKGSNAEAEVSGDRLSNRFRAETCDLMVRTMINLGLKKQKDGRKKTQWLKDTCDQSSFDKML